MKNLFLCTYVLAALTLGPVPAHAHGPAEHGNHDASEVGTSDAGSPGNPKQVTRTIRIDMTDSMRFAPETVIVKRGQTVKFVVKNSGHLLHEMVLGATETLKEHAQAMAKSPTMHHADPNTVQVEPGRSGTIVWRFSGPGEFRYACLQPGHYEAGMIGRVIVQ